MSRPSIVISLPTLPPLPIRRPGTHVSNRYQKWSVMRGSETSSGWRGEGRPAGWIFLTVLQQTQGQAFAIKAGRNTRTRVTRRLKVSGMKPHRGSCTVRPTISVCELSTSNAEVAVYFLNPLIIRLKNPFFSGLDVRSVTATMAFSKTSEMPV